MIRSLLLALFAGLLAFAQTLPKAPNRHVTDPQGFLSLAATQRLTEELKALESAVPCQAIVWIGDLPPGFTKEDFAARAFKAWGIGHKEAKDGVALFVFPATRGLRLEVGYGLEGRLTDLDSGRILREAMSPRLKAGDRDGALLAGVAGIRAVLLPDSPAPQPPPPTSEPVSSADPDAAMGAWIIFSVLVLLIVIVKISRWFRGLPTTYSSGGSSSGWWDSGGSGSSDSSSDDFFSGGGGDSGGGGASGDW